VRFGCVAVLGVGLIGGSCALAWKRAGCVDRVIGVGRSRPNLDRAIELGVIDSIAPSVADAVREADAVLITTPVGQFEALLREVGPALKADAFITDGGSTKRDVVAAARGAGRPVLAALRPGPPHRRRRAFRGRGRASRSVRGQRHVVLTPLPETAPDAEDRVHCPLAATGARCPPEPGAARRSLRGGEPSAACTGLCAGPDGG
jgi:prephenate dehydrogenase